MLILVRWCCFCMNPGLTYMVRGVGMWWSGVGGVEFLGSGPRDAVQQCRVRLRVLPAHGRISHVHLAACHTAVQAHHARNPRRGESAVWLEAPSPAAMRRAACPAKRSPFQNLAGTYTPSLMVWRATALAAPPLAVRRATRSQERPRRWRHGSRTSAPRRW